MSTATADIAKTAEAGLSDFRPSTATPAEVKGFSRTDEAITAMMTTLVKGAGFAVTDKPSAFGQGGNAALIDPTDIFPRAMRAETEWNDAINKGWKDPVGVVNSWNPLFNAQFPALAMMFKNYTTSSPLATGFAPFNLVAPCAS